MPEKCPVLGFVLNYENTKTADNSPSLDRIDNDLGYVLGNVIVVSWKANRLKSNATVNELEAIAKFYGELQS